MKLSLFELLYGLSEALDHVESEWHPLPKVHAKKTAYFAVRMGECAGLKKEKLYQLALAGLFHDSGITRSQGGLCREKEGTKEELKFRLLAGEENFMQLPIRNPKPHLVLFHRERGDGSGAFGRKAGEYPREAGWLHLAERVSRLEAGWDEKTLRKEEIERKKINKEKYSKIDQLDFKMIGTVKEGKNKGRKLVAKTENRNPQVVDLNDSRKIKISKTGEIIFKNSVLLCNSVNEYLISRIINGKEKKDKIYTNLSLPSLTEDNLDYYNCVVNEMLSEDVIEVVTKYNGGYIGMIEKDEASGGYKATIRDKSLNTEEQEIFAAVMINLENEKNKENKKQEDNILEL